MTTQVCIENTAELCEATQASALATASSHESNPNGIGKATRWSDVRERLDGKFDTVVYEHHDYGSKTVQDYSRDDYDSEE